MAARRVRVAGMLGCMAVLFTTAGPAGAEIAYAPLTFRTANGIRPFVDVAMDGHPFQMMVHADARFTLMTTHANARKAGIVKPVHTGSYGVTKLGHAVVMEISTVSNNIIDTQVAAAAKIPLGPAIDDYGGPGGLLGKVYIAKRTVTLVLDGQRAAPDRPQTTISTPTTPKRNLPRPIPRTRSNLARISCWRTAP